MATVTTILSQASIHLSEAGNLDSSTEDRRIKQLKGDRLINLLASSHFMEMEQKILSTNTSNLETMRSDLKICLGNAHLSPDNRDNLKSLVDTIGLVHRNSFRTTFTSLTLEDAHNYEEKGALPPGLLRRKATADERGIEVHLIDAKVKCTLAAALSISPLRLQLQAKQSNLTLLQPQVFTATGALSDERFDWRLLIDFLDGQREIEGMNPYEREILGAGLDYAQVPARALRALNILLDALDYRKATSIPTRIDPLEKMVGQGVLKLSAIDSLAKLDCLPQTAWEHLLELECSGTTRPTVEELGTLMKRMPNLKTVRIAPASLQRYANGLRARREMTSKLISLLPRTLEGFTYKETIMKGGLLLELSQRCPNLRIIEVRRQYIPLEEMERLHTFMENTDPEDWPSATDLQESFPRAHTIRVQSSFNILPSIIFISGCIGTICLLLITRPLDPSREESSTVILDFLHLFGAFSLLFWADVLRGLSAASSPEILLNLGLERIEDPDRDEAPKGSLQDLLQLNPFTG